MTRAEHLQMFYICNPKINMLRLINSFMTTSAMKCKEIKIFYFF